MTEFIVAHRFSQGDWTYQQGETFTVEQLADRGFTEADIDHWRRRGALTTQAEIDEQAAADAAAEAQAEPEPAPGPLPPSFPPVLGRDED